ncbi:MAG: peptidoglycan-associated lipoprotein, partial [Chlorobiales bacterium]|nr:peptidoglycan-associated lipoprotein [Chlorobiales bacterium]
MKKLLLVCWVIAAVSVAGCSSKSSEPAVSTDPEPARYKEPVVTHEMLLEEARRIVKDVFFAFDSAELDQVAVSQLKNNAIWLVQNEGVSVLIEG